jgi:hypothetical protein
VERFFNKNRLEYVIFNLCHQDNAPHCCKSL